MQKPVNNEIDLIRSIYSRSSELVLEAKAKKLTPKTEEPNLFSAPAETPAETPAATPTAKPSKAKSSGKAKKAVAQAVAEPVAAAEPTTVSSSVSFDPLTKKQGNSVFAKKSKLSSPIDAISDPLPSFGTSEDILSPSFRMTPKRPSTVETAYGIINRKPVDLNQDGQVSKAEEELVPTPPSIPVPKTPAATTVASPTMAFGLGRGLKNIANSPRTLPAVLAAGMGLAGMYGAMYGGKGVPAQQSANVTSPINAVSPTNPTNSPFEAPPDPGQRKWAPYNVMTNPDRMSPIREQQEITGYYRQALAQRLEEASAAFWAGRAGATRQEVEAAEASERFNILAPFKAMEPNKYPVRNMPVKKKKEVESVPLKREDRFQFPNDPVTRGERNLKWLSDPTSAPSTSSGPTIQQPLIPSSMLPGLEGRLKGAQQWWAGETKEVIDSSDDYSDGADKEVSSTENKKVKKVRLGAPLLPSDIEGASLIKKRMMEKQTRRAQPTTQAPRETFDAEGIDMTVELPKFPKLSPSRQAQIGINLERELARAHGTVEKPKEHAGDDIDDDTKIDTKLPSIGSHAKREDASKSTAVRILSRLYPASSRVSDVGDIAPVSAENPPTDMSLAQLKIDAKAAKQRKSHAALQNIYSDLFSQHAPDVATPKSENLPVEPVLRNSDGQLTGRTDVSLATPWPKLVAQQLAPHWGKAKVPFKDEHTPKGQLRKTPRHPALNALSQVKLSEPHTFGALLPHVDDATRASLQQHMDYLAKNSARDVETPKSDVGTLLKNISRF